MLIGAVLMCSGSVLRVTRDPRTAVVGTLMLVVGLGLLVASIVTGR